MKLILSLTLLILVSTFSIPLIFASNEERITIATYYPSPQGSYLNMEIGRRLVLGNDGRSAGRDFMSQSITGFNDGIEATDAAIFVSVWRSSLESDLRLYILDDPDDKFSIWGNTCGNAGRCNDINAATNVATFQADGKIALGLGVHYNAPLDTTLVVSNNGNDADWDNATQLAISRYNSKQFALQLGYAYVSGNYAGGRIQAVDNGTGRPLLLNPIGGNVGVGTTNPQAALDVNGQIVIRGGSPAAGKVLTSDANGLATWQGGGGSLECRSIEAHHYGAYTAQVSCDNIDHSVPPGTWVLTGGGGSCVSNGSDPDWLVTNYQDGDNGWKVRCRTPYANSEIWAIARCCKR